jgi:putative membrane protein
MKRILLVAAGLGLALAILIVANEGFAAVGTAFASIGWGVALIVLFRVIQLAGAGLGWWYLFPRGSGCPPQVCVLVRWLREAINALLPVAQVGGEIAGARIVTFFGITGGLAGASVLVDMLMQAGTQFLFVLLGLALLVSAGVNETMLGWILIGVVVMALALTAFFMLQRFGGVRMVERALLKLADHPRWSSVARVANLHDHLLIIYDDLPRLAVAAVVHFAVWLVGAAEIYVALHLMGYPVSYGEAIVIESLGQAVRTSAFLVPGAYGIQEGGFIALCALFGIPAPTALALSLVKRVPDFVLGLPGLLTWHALESRQILRRRREKAA